MEYVRLGATDLNVSRLGLGCEVLGGTDWGVVDEKLAMSAVSRALDVGINLFDTADVYGLGRSEEMLSRALGERRYDVVIVSKFGVNWREDPCGGRAKTFFDSSPRHVVTALERSLRRLRIDCIPLYLIHWPDPKTPISATMEALIKCQAAGKVRYIGVSNFPASLMLEAHRVARLAAVEVQYSLVHRHVEQDLLPHAQQEGIPVLVYGTLAQGLLTGKYSPESRFDGDDRRHRLPHFSEKAWPTNLRIIDRVRRVCARYGKEPAQVAVRWVLSNPAVSCAIVGAKSPAQVDSNVGALGWELSPEDQRYLAESP